MSMIVDFNQVVISNLYMQVSSGDTDIEESIFRHMVLNSLRSYKQKFGLDYGEMVLACDNHTYWRKQIFPYYKASRKKAQEKSKLNWTLVYEYLNKIKSEIKAAFPYRVIDVELAEADDVIATLCEHAEKDMLILSADKDFIQLQTNPHIKQYDPVHKKWVRHDNPTRYKLEHIIRGDAGDGIPNILSNDNCLVVGERQRSITKKRLDFFIGGPVSAYDDVAQRNFYRNEQLIDLSKIPQDLKAKIIQQYISQVHKKRDKLMMYFMQHRLKNLLEHIHEF